MDDLALDDLPLDGFPLDDQPHNLPPDRRPDDLAAEDTEKELPGALGPPAFRQRRAVVPGTLPSRQPDSKPRMGVQKQATVTPIGLLLGALRFILNPFSYAAKAIIQRVFHAIGLVTVVLVTLYFGWGWLRDTAASMLPSATWTVAYASAGVVATPTCLLVGVWCDYSLAGPNTTVASIVNKLRGRNTVDVAVVSRELSVETKRAKNFFDSLTALNEGRYTSGQDHMRLHSLGVSFQVGSSLPNKGVIGAELVAVSTIDLHRANNSSRTSPAKWTTRSWR